MESPFDYWSTYANALFWLVLILLDFWIICKFANRRMYTIGALTEWLKPHLQSKSDAFLWIFIFFWFSALLLLETYSLFALWAECFVGCLDNVMKSQSSIGKAWVWFLLVSVPAMMLLSVAVALAWACASIVELSLWAQYWEVIPPGDEEKVALVVVALEEAE